MTRRYYVPDLVEPLPPCVELPADESKHAATVMRVQVQDQLQIFNGQGICVAATVRSVTRKKVVVEPQASAILDNPPLRDVRLWVSLPKPERAKEMIARLTEMGVREITPLLCERGQRPPSGSLLEKLDRGVIEACKQCGRNDLMQIRPPMTLQNAFSSDGPEQSCVTDETVPSDLQAPFDSPAVRYWIAHPGDEPPAAERSTFSRDGPITLAIGPEGGFTDAEVEWAIGNSFRTLCFGPLIYRIETAAVVAAALALHPKINL